MSIIKSTLASFPEEVTKLNESGQKYFICFKGSVDPETNESWCSDCVKADPVLNEHLFPKLAEESVPVIMVNCGLRDEWKDQKNNARTHPMFKVSGVPAVYKVIEGAVTAKLVEEQLFNPQMLEMMLED